ncbi:hypothetical protein [Aeromonas veronii]|jgi:hypothetical protein|uniref:hypothetical protein n=1 Tax=Aeromonas veronii TaxID=654 RepID=UPI00111AD25F|nr:hypothetical protein [Aeromonas veronii]TNI37866.1 hypothetical protein CF128_10645 [Aeromonas veronii]
MIDLGGNVNTSPGGMLYLPSDKNVVVDGASEYLRSGILKLASNYPEFPAHLRLGTGYIFATGTQPQNVFRGSASNDNIIVLIGGDNSNVAYWSGDGGVTIHTTTLPFTDNWGSVAYGNGIFLAVSQTGKVAKSTDGKVWTAATATPFTTVSPRGAIAFGNGKFVVVGLGSVPVHTANGTAWTTIPDFVTTQLDSVTYDGAVFAAVYTGVTVYVWDGVTVKQRSLPSGGSSYRLAGYNGVTVAMATGGTKAAAVSYDNCDSWQSVEAPFLSYQNSQSISVANGRFYAASASGIAVTESGAHWTVLSLPKAIPVSHVAGDDLSIVALNLTGTNSAYSNAEMDAIGAPVYSPNLYLRIK